ncbi:hypothetical protein [Peribacillus frigoritolerans]|uniref:hypothetical protein n=1 Tax=Peribacillus frigoritolerans TaxID=450367 RepID=UPI003F7D6EDE
MITINNVERAYTTKEIADTLEIGDSTLRKWCASLEKNGYIFTKNDQNYRLFVEHDIIFLRQFKKLVKEANMPLDNASSLILERFSGQSITTRTGVVPLETGTQDTRSLDAITKFEEKIMERFNQQEEVNRQLVELIKKQNKIIEDQKKYIEEKFDERDQQLTESIRAAKETKKLLIEQKEQEKRGFFSKLFGK